MNNIKKTIGWADFSWNPITGCLKGCSYCYARRIYARFKKSFKPEFHYDRLTQPVKLEKPSRIFVCSVADFWGKGTLQIWRDEVYNIIRACPEHTFIFLTKQPHKIKDFDRVPGNCWIGVSYTKYGDEWRIAQLIHRTHNYEKIFISYEPMMDGYTDYLFLGNWLIVGAMTGAQAREHKPDSGALLEIIQTSRRLKLPLFMKNNLKPYWPGELIQQWPERKGAKCLSS